MKAFNEETHLLRVFSFVFVKSIMSLVLKKKKLIKTFKKLQK